MDDNIRYFKVTPHKDSYKGFKLRPSKQKSCKYVQLHRSSRIIEYNVEFFNRLNQYQEYFMLEWCIRNRMIRDEYQCDLKTKALYLSKGFEIRHIYEMFGSMRFGSIAARQNRIDNLFHGKKEPDISFAPSTIYYNISDFLHRLWKKNQ